MCEYGLLPLAFTYIDVKEKTLNKKRDKVICYRKHIL